MRLIVLLLLMSTGLTALRSMTKQRPVPSWWFDLATADSTTAAARVLLSGKELTQTVSDTDQAVTIYALVQDAKGNNLLDTGVDFTAVTNPSGIVSDRELSDDPVTKSVVDDTPTDADEQIEVQGLANAVADGTP